MTYVLYFMALGSNFFASLHNRRSKLVLGFSALVILLLWVGCADGPDILNYQLHFDLIGERVALHGWSQILFNRPMYYLKSIGFSFYQYRFSVTLMALMLIYVCLVKLRTNIHLVLCGYLSSAFFLEGIQFRNFLAIPFLLFGVLLLIRRNPGWRIWYILTILIAAFIHNTFVVYLIFLFLPAPHSSIRKIIWAYGLLALGLTIFFFMFRNHLNLITDVLMAYDERRTLQFSHYVTKLGAFVPIILQGMAIYTVRFIRLKLSKRHNVSQQDLQTIQTILGIDLLACFFLPLCILQITFYRLIRNLLLVNWAAIGIGSYYLRKNLIFNLLVIVYMTAWMVAEFHLMNTFDVIVQPLFSSNLYL